MPGAIFVAGYNLGLLTVGVNNIPTDFTSVIDAANTTRALTDHQHGGADAVDHDHRSRQGPGQR